MSELIEEIFAVNETTFEKTALQVFRYGSKGVHVYRKFSDSLGKTPDSVMSIKEIPFLPIEFFKSYEVLQAGKQPVTIFESSGTTGSTPSRHYVTDSAIYERSFLTAFKPFYGEPEDYAILALLPSYLERGNSSLVYMADKLIKLSANNKSGFFLNDFGRLSDLLIVLKKKNQRTILLGVTFALLDFAGIFQIDFPELIVMETGGMKGRREELTREEVHQKLTKAFGVSQIHSEYGMTELLSQGYSKGDGIFESPAWMKVLTRDVYDPLQFQETGKPGAANVIDLANLYSCSFIATNDLARVNENGSFEILGRMDNAEIRGCNLMVI